MADNDLSGMIARLHNFEQRHEHDQLALQSMAKQLEEVKERAARAEAKAAAYGKDTARLMAERDSWKASAQKMIADRTFAEEGEHG